MSTLAQMIGSAFPGGGNCLCAPDDAPGTVAGRRSKLWELPHAFHCALIGTCLPVPDMRRLAPHSGYDVSNMSDYSLHTTVVNNCDSRNPLTDAIQRFLDKRHARVIARFAPAPDAAAVAALWQEALASGDDVPGALWAIWTHPATDGATGKAVHGDIHMLSHQVGAAVRGDLRQLEQHKADAASLRKEVTSLRRAMNRAAQEHAAALAALRRELAAADQIVTRHRRLETELADAARALKQQNALQQRVASLTTRAEAAEEWNTANSRRAAQLELDLVEARAERAIAEKALAEALGVRAAADEESPCGMRCPPAASLEGRCVLCVGGRSGLVDGYRKLVEQSGGSFLHHDGGQEESLHRIDAAIARADAVVCQSACVSHAAYWRLKDACKRLGKPCLFVKSPGIGSFARSLSALVNAGPADQVIRVPA